MKPLADFIIFVLFTFILLASWRILSFWFPSKKKPLEPVAQLPMIMPPARPKPKAPPPDPSVTNIQVNHIHHHHNNIIIVTDTKTKPGNKERNSN